MTMKQKLFTLFAMLMCSMSMYADRAPEEPKLEVYTEFVEKTGTLTYYYDMQRSERTGVTELYNPYDPAERFNSYATKVKKAVIAPSMKDAPLKSMNGMFCGGSVPEEAFTFYYLSNMTNIEGLENLNTTSVTNMDGMFIGCAASTPR